MVNSVLTLNPGQLSKKKASGTYASLTLHPREMSEEEVGDGKMLGHNVFERARVDVLRI